jgi:hypothetical protein
MLGTSIFLLTLSSCGDSKQIKEIKPLQSAETPTINRGEGNEIFYDDGTIDSQYSPWVYETGSQIGVIFSPSFYPAVLTKARFFVGMNGIPTTRFRVRVFGGTVAAGPDENDDFLESHVTASAPFGNKWIDVDLSTQNIIITSGDFCVAMEWLTPPGDRGESAQCLGADNSDPDARSWWKADSRSDWIRIDDVANVGDRDIMIRATISKK